MLNSLLDNMRAGQPSESAIIFETNALSLVQYELFEAIDEEGCAAEEAEEK